MTTGVVITEYGGSTAPLLSDELFSSIITPFCVVVVRADDRVVFVDGDVTVDVYNVVVVDGRVVVVVVDGLVTMFSKRTHVKTRLQLRYRKG